VLATLIAGVIPIGAFLFWERRATSPMIPLELFRRPGFAAANAVSFCMYGGVFGALFLMTQLLQVAQGHSPLIAGCSCSPGPWRLGLSPRSRERSLTATATGRS
jgi:hypothetical protein